MPRHLYVAVIERERGEPNWSILFPDFPEIASVAETPDDWATQAFDALSTAIDARREDGQPVPDPTPLDQVTQDWPYPWPAKPVLVAVESSVSAIRVNVSLEQALLERIDRAAERRGMTRSGLLAEGARRLLRDEAA